MCVCACVRVRACVRACVRVRACVCVCVCARARDFVCVFLPRFVSRCLLISVCFVRMYPINLYNYVYLCIVCVSLSCKAL